MSTRPCDEAKVVVIAPDYSEPWTAPTAPPSICISCTTDVAPDVGQAFGARFRSPRRE